MNFIDWFDPHDIDHVKAYKHLTENGTWPKGFIPENVEMGFHWQYKLFAKMAECWMDYLTLDNL